MAEAGPGAWGNCRGAPGVDSDQEEVSSRGETSAPPFTPGFSRVGSEWGSSGMWSMRCDVPGVQF